MAYFPNGTAGEVLDEQCAECLHADPEAGCPVAFVQMEFNYSQHNPGNEDLEKAMDMLIDKKGVCRMKPLIDVIGAVHKNKKCFQRPLAFGDEEQIAAMR